MFSGRTQALCARDSGTLIGAALLASYQDENLCLRVQDQYQGHSSPFF